MDRDASVGARNQLAVSMIRPAPSSTNRARLRALDIPKDECGFRCIEYPDGLPLKTREDEPFLTINGIQVQGTEVIDMAPQRDELAACGVGILRLYPQTEGMAGVVDHFRRMLESPVPPPPLGARNGYWYGRPGKASLSMPEFGGR